MTVDVNVDVNVTANRRGNRRTVATIQRELETLVQRHGQLLALGDEHASTKKKCKDRKRVLRGYHAAREFHGNYQNQNEHEHENNGDENDPLREVSTSNHYLSLFDEFARMVCHTAVIPRKELFEAWAMALYVHFYFPPSKEDENGDDGEADDPPHNNYYRRKYYYNRVADMGCGQGLVSWAILFLDKSETRTAIGIDKKIPKSCDIIEKVMTERHPSVAEFLQTNDDDVINNGDCDCDGGENGSEEEEKKEDKTATGSQQQPFEAEVEAEETTTRRRRRKAAAASFKRWHWVEGDICKNVSADSSTLIVGVHCCGTLSDTILDLAISSRSALALVPCCHTRKSLPRGYKNDPIKMKELLAENARENEKNTGGDSNNDNNNNNNITNELLPTTLTDYIDRYRMKKLTDAGYDVQEERIPSVITPKNRIIVAIPPPPEDVLTGDSDYDANNNNSDEDNTSGGTTTKTADSPPTTNTDQQPKKYEKSQTVFTIPLADTPRARSIVASQSGRIAADLRQRRPPPNLSLSLYLPDPEHSMTVEKMNAFTDTIAKQEQHKHFPDACGSSSDGRSSAATPTIITTHVKYGSHGLFAHPENGNFSRSYRIGYEVNDPSGRLPQVTKVQAKALHTIVCKHIKENFFPGITLRQGIKEIIDDKN